MNRASGKPVDQPAVDRSKCKLAAAGARTRARHIVECPRHFRSRKVGVSDKNGLSTNYSLKTVLLQPVADWGGSAALPDNGIVNRQTGAAVPDDGRLALIGDADCSDPAGFYSAAFEGGSSAFKLRLPDRFRVVLDPARLREDLQELPLSDLNNLTFAIKDDRPGGCSAVM